MEGNNNTKNKVLKKMEFWGKFNCNSKFIFLHFISYLAASRPTLGHYQEAPRQPSANNCVFIWFDPKVIRILVMGLGSKARPSASVGFEPGTFQFRIGALLHCATLPKKDEEEKHIQNFYKNVLPLFFSLALHWLSVLK